MEGLSWNREEDVVVGLAKVLTVFALLPPTTALWLAQQFCHEFVNMDHGREELCRIV